MKITLFLSMLFCAIALPALGELTDTDLNKIRLIINEEIEEEIKPIKADIVSLKTDVAWIRGKLENVDKQITHVTLCHLWGNRSHYFARRYSTNHYDVAQQKRSLT